MSKGNFWWGVFIGVGGTWAYHAFIHPMPTTKS
jgi:hypothetical protein